jgi:hypothetical protein
VDDRPEGAALSAWERARELRSMAARELEEEVRKGRLRRVVIPEQSKRSKERRKDRRAGA